MATETVRLGELLVRVVTREQAAAGDAARTAVLRPGRALTIGSASDVDLPLAEPTVSGRHVRLEHRLSCVVATDLGSKNGTRLFGHAVAEARVGPGAQLGIGAARVEVLSAEAERPRGEALPGIVGTSPPMIELAARVRRFATLSEPALLRGESGTGKELVARALHTLGPRSKKPFVAINAASLSRELAESELFGHRRGAFTGAIADRKGAFREACGGTLFIDEVAQLGPDVQAKLLRAVEQQQVRPLGSDVAVPVDVRLVAATCEPIEEYVAIRRFRADLFQRIAVCVLRIPSLRDRMSDLPALASCLMETFGARASLLRPCAVRALGTAMFTGNVRELRNVLLQATLIAGPDVPIEERHVLTALRERGGIAQRPTAESARDAVEGARGNVSAAARTLGIPRSTLRDLLARDSLPR